LINTTYVKWSWLTCSGVKGVLFTEISSGNNLFLPACGAKNAYGNLTYVGNYCYYWSSTHMTYTNNYNAYYLQQSTASPTINWGGKTNGYSVRPVLA